MNNNYGKTASNVFVADHGHYASTICQPDIETPKPVFAAKDAYGHYTHFDQTMLPQVGVDGVKDVLGRTDFDMGWHVSAVHAHPLERAAISGKYQEQELSVYIPGIGIRQFLYQIAPAPVGRGEVGMCADVTHLHTSAWRKPDADYSGHVLPLENGEALSWREYQTLKLLTEGLSRADIARSIGITVGAVDAYKERMRTKLGCHNRWLPRNGIKSGALLRGLLAHCWKTRK